MTDCIIFPGCKTAAGYGLKQHEGKLRLAHRVAYVQHHGLSHADIEGFVIRHECDTPGCWNAEHLKKGTQSQNILDAVARGRHDPQRGAARRTAVLTEELVRKIREGGKSAAAWARELGVGVMTISNARSRKTWAHI